MLNPDKLALIERIHLDSGAHDNFEAGVCAMELVSYIADEPFSDHPQCVCPVLGAFVRTWNDGLPDGERDAILKPILPHLIGTRGSDALAARRALMAADWLVRVHTPAWLRLAKLDVHADALAVLSEITPMRWPLIHGLVKAAQRDAIAAGFAAWVAATAAAKAAAGDAARIAAGDAAGYAVTATAWDAATAAARAAAWDAAGDALKDTRVALQRSAVELVNRMIAEPEPV